VKYLNRNVILSGIIGLLSTCSPAMPPQSLVDDYANGAKNKIVLLFYGGGDDIRFQTKSYFYNTNSDVFRITVRITWKKANHDSRFWAEGDLVVRRKSSRMTWTANSLSANLKTFLDEIGMVNGFEGVTNLVAEYRVQENLQGNGEMSIVSP